MMEADVGSPRCEAFCLGEWFVEPSLNRLSRSDHRVRLRPKVMDLLVALAGCEPGQTVRKADLVDKVWPSDAVADSALFRAVFELREALGDDPRHPHAVLTVPRHGYRLLLPVTAASDRVCRQQVPGRKAPLPVSAGRPEPRRQWRAAAAVLGLTLVLMVACLQSGHGAPFPTLPAAGDAGRLLVLPFSQEGQSADPYLAAGIGDELAGRLVGRSHLTVVVPGHDMSAAFRSADLVAIGKQYGVGRVLAGTVVWPTAADQELRVDVRIIRVSTGEVTWRVGYSLKAIRTLDQQGRVAAALADEVLAGEGALHARAAASREAAPPA